jgi:hypothetical protein
VVILAREGARSHGAASVQVCRQRLKRAARPTYVGRLYLNPLPRSTLLLLRLFGRQPIYPGARINVGVHELLSRDEDLGAQPDHPTEVLK